VGDLSQRSHRSEEKKRINAEVTEVRGGNGSWEKLRSGKPKNEWVGGRS
jgi:hypothetical protein